MKRKFQKINKYRSWFFEKVKKMDKSFTSFIKMYKEKTQKNEVRNEGGEITIDTTEIQRIGRNYYEQLHTKKFENLDEMNKFLEKYNLPKLIQEKPESLNRKITTSEIEAVIKKLPAHKSP